MTSSTLSPSRRKLWLAAIKPPMYSVAVIPIWVGTAIAYAQTHVIHWPTFVGFLLSAILILAWINLSNDVFDSETGIDANKAHSLVNLTGNKNLIFWLGNTFLGLGILGILAIALWQKDLTIIGIVLLCCFLGYTYQGPQFRLGYQGLGEIICFVCFGPLAVGAAYYSQTQSWAGFGQLSAILAWVIVGLTTSLILFCSHFHQVKDDLAAGKRSPIVRLGTLRGAQLLPVICGIVYGFTLLGWGLGWLSISGLLIFASLPFAIQLCRHVGQYHDQPEKVSNCKFIAVNLHFFSGFLLGLGYLWVF